MNRAHVERGPKSVAKKRQDARAHGGRVRTSARQHRENDKDDARWRRESGAQNPSGLRDRALIAVAYTFTCVGTVLQMKLLRFSLRFGCAIIH